VEKVIVRGWIEELGIIPALRVESAEDALFAAKTLYQSGIPLVEIPWTVPNAPQVISDLVKIFPDMVVGAGSILNKEAARRCLDAGASFLTSEWLDLEVAKFAVEENCVAIPGAMSFSETNSAWDVASDYIKIFPCSHVGGPKYIRDLKEAFPDVPVIAAGGVTQQTASSYIQAGAVALGIGEALVPAEAVQRRNTRWIAELARRFIEIVKTARNEMAAHQVQFSIAHR
jgi:2-dehydro-3-deoxyphosphogluconate aldolase / (4S)-4-hydroxy-2-oxoglutarate aldolase